MKDALRVSMIIRVFNGERTIAAAIDSERVTARCRMA